MKTVSKDVVQEIGSQYDLMKLFDVVRLPAFKGGGFSAK